MRPNISELSYGYAVTDELIHWHGNGLTAAPVFPSLYQEGQEGGGYDVKLELQGIPLFLQFKLSDCMVSRLAREARLGLLRVPYYRMHLRPARYSSQQRMLLQLEREGQEVYYSAPAFHQLQELNRFYLQRQILERSLWVRPSYIGELPDPEDHYLAFQLHGPYIFYSEPRKIDAKATFEDFSSAIQLAFQKRAETALLPEQLSDLAALLTDISQERIQTFPGLGKDLRALIEDSPPIKRIAFYSEFFLGCRFFIVHKKKSEMSYS